MPLKRRTLVELLGDSNNVLLSRLSLSATERPHISHSTQGSKSNSVVSQSFLGGQVLCGWGVRLIQHSWQCSGTTLLNSRHLTSNLNLVAHFDSLISEGTHLPSQNEESIATHSYQKVCDDPKSQPHYRSGALNFSPYPCRCSRDPTPNIVFKPILEKNSKDSAPLSVTEKLKQSIMVLLSCSSSFNRISFKVQLICPRREKLNFPTPTKCHSG